MKKLKSIVKMNIIYIKLLTKVKKDFKIVYRRM